MEQALWGPPDNKSGVSKQKYVVFNSKIEIFYCCLEKDEHAGHILAAPKITTGQPENENKNKLRKNM